LSFAAAPPRPPTLLRPTHTYICAALRRENRGAGGRERYARTVLRTRMHVEQGVESESEAACTSRMYVRSHVVGQWIVGVRTCAKYNFASDCRDCAVQLANAPPRRACMHSGRSHAHLHGLLSSHEGRRQGGRRCKRRCGVLLFTQCTSGAKHRLRPICSAHVGLTQPLPSHAPTSS